MKDNRTSKTMIGTFFLLHVLSWRMAAGHFAECFALSGASVAPSSARGPFSGSVHRECSGRTRGPRKGLDSLSHDTFVIICSGQGIKRGTSSPHSRRAGNQLSTKDTFRKALASFWDMHQSGITLKPLNVLVEILMSWRSCGASSTHKPHPNIHRQQSNMSQ